MKYEEDSSGHGRFVLDSGRDIKTNGEMRISEYIPGFHKSVIHTAFHGAGEYSDYFPTDLTDAERAEIADYAIDLWRQWRHQK